MRKRIVGGALGFCLAAATLLLGAASVVIVVVALIRGVAGSVQWGDVAGWTSTIMTAAAFFAGVAVIRRDNRLRRDDEARRSDAERRAQAELITAWVRTQEIGVAGLGLSNGSHAVVYDLFVEVSCTPAPDDKDGLISPQSTLGEAEELSYGHAAMLPPGRPSFGNLDLTGHVLPHRVAIYFMDSRGEWWHRSTDGLLAPSSRPQWADQGLWRVRPLDLTQPLR